MADNTSGEKLTNPVILSNNPIQPSPASTKCWVCSGSAVYSADNKTTLCVVCGRTGLLYTK